MQWHYPLSWSGVIPLEKNAWEERKDGESGEMYYYNRVGNFSTWRLNDVRGNMGLAEVIDEDDCEEGGLEQVLKEREMAERKIKEKVGGGGNSTNTISKNLTKINTKLNSNNTANNQLYKPEGLKKGESFSSFFSRGFLKHSGGAPTGGGGGGGGVSVALENGYDTPVLLGIDGETIVESPTPSKWNNSPFSLSFSPRGGNVTSNTVDSRLIGEDVITIDNNRNTEDSSSTQPQSIITYIPTISIISFILALLFRQLPTTKTPLVNNAESITENEQIHPYCIILGFFCVFGLLFIRQLNIREDMILQRG